MLLLPLWSLAQKNQVAIQIVIKTWRINRIFLFAKSHKSNTEVLKIFVDKDIFKVTRQGIEQKLCDKGSLVSECQPNCVYFDHLPFAYKN